LLRGGRYIQAIAAVALARAGDSTQAAKIADDLEKNYPHDTIVNFYWAPSARAILGLNRHNPSKALELLQAAGAYELGNPAPTVGPLSPVYFRGYAYMQAGQSREAAREFQRIIDHPGIVVNSPVGALAHLGLARASTAIGDLAGARTAYQDFLALWRDADPDIPILKQAKAEYAKLQ